MPVNKPKPASALIPLRTALILLLATLSASAIAGLVLLDGRSIAVAVALGLGSFVGAVKFFHWLISST
jgi:uncharacterized membrane protein YgaE (UPF0421/DUF939 family)